MMRLPKLLTVRSPKRGTPVSLARCPRRSPRAGGCSAKGHRYRCGGRRFAAAAFAAVGFWTAEAAGQGQSVPYFPAASDTVLQGFVRVVNRDPGAGSVSIEAIDDAGRRFGPVTLSIRGGETVHFNSDDLEGGNAAKGLSGDVGAGSGDWRLELESELDLEVLAYLRTEDGFLTAMHDAVPLESHRHRVPIFNPASNVNQVSLLRLTNAESETATVRISGVDGAGAGGETETAVPAGASRTLTAADLERMGLGDGAGKWQLLVDSDRPVRVMNLLRSPTGHLTNLSTAPATAEVDGDGRIVHRVPLLPAAGGNVQGFVRVINHGGEPGEVSIRAFDDGGIERGTLRLELAGRQTAHFNSDDLARGNDGKGLSGSVSAGEGDWRLEFASDLPIEVLAYARTRDGFLTSLHDTAPTVGRDRHVAVFNPGRNRDQVSSLRLVNPGEEAADVTIVAVDDDGRAPGGEVSVSVPASGAVTYTVLELEEGSGAGLAGAIGAGAGKWRLRVTSRAPVRVLSLMRSPTGHLTNLSTSPAPPGVRMVALATDVSIPGDVRSLSAGDVAVATLGRETAVTAADGSSSVLVAADGGGTVMLALADEGGGFLDAYAGSVDVGIDSTALALAATASGRPLHRVDRGLAEAIRGDDDFERLAQLLTGLMAADKNYLDRLYEYPEAVGLVKRVAAGAASTLAEARARGSGSAAGDGRPGPAVMSRGGEWGVAESPPAAVGLAGTTMWAGRVSAAGAGTFHARSGPVEALGKEDFYCWRSNRFVSVVGWIPWFGDAIVEWVPCSPWHAGQPWTWYGDAVGLETYADNVVDLLGEALGLLADPLSRPAWYLRYYQVAIEAAASQPFLAVSRAAGEERTVGGHAIANPNFVNFAMEARTSDGHDRWTYVPRNFDVLGKLLSSGAEYFPVSTPDLDADIDTVRFQRYRFDFLSGEEPARVVSWMNALHLGLAAANVFTDVSGARRALRDGRAWVGCTQAMATDIGDGGASEFGDAVVLDASGRAPQERLWDFFSGFGRTVLAAPLNKQCREVVKGAFRDGLKAGAETAAKLTPLGWGLLAFDAANEAVPTAAAYFRPGAGRVDYHLSWATAADGSRYLSGVSRTRGPAATFAYRQGDGFEGELDGTQTEPGDSAGLTFEWSVDGSHVGGGQRLTHWFGAAGAYRVDLLVTDGNGVTGEFSQRVEVTDGRPPVIAALACARTDAGTIRMQIDVEDADGEIDRVEWHAGVRLVHPNMTTGPDTTEVELDFVWSWAAAAVVDDRGNRARKTCLVRDPSREGGETFRDAMDHGGLAPEMTVVPAGSFRMGCLNNDGECESNEFPVHEVRFERPFALSSTEVTVAQFRRFAERSEHDHDARGCRHWDFDDREWYWDADRTWRDPGFPQEDDHPVVCVDWQDARAYAAWLSQETGKTYRLPSESEWEYAARAGTETVYHFGNDASELCRWGAVGDFSTAAWTGRPAAIECRDGYVHTAPAGSFAPNPWGLYDVHGNVWEWTEDCSHRNYRGAPDDGSAWASGNCGDRMARGGTWGNGPLALRAARRDPGQADRPYWHVGFRVARVLDHE